MNKAQGYEIIIREISRFDWACLSIDELGAVAKAYYYFSVQFRESLNLACEIRPLDTNLQSLRSEECDTDNLSPYPGIAEAGERMNHDEYMRRVVAMLESEGIGEDRIDQLGEAYLAVTRQLPDITRAMSIATYEDGGLSSVFNAILTAEEFDTAALKAFKHFLVEHIRFDTDEVSGHGALARHFAPDDRVVVLWTAFRDLLLGAVPNLARSSLVHEEQAVFA